MTAELLSSQDLCCGGEAERRHICPDFPFSFSVVTHPEGNPVDCLKSKHAGKQPSLLLGGD